MPAKRISAPPPSAKSRSTRVSPSRPSVHSKGWSDPLLALQRRRVEALARHRHGARDVGQRDVVLAGHHVEIERYRDRKNVGAAAVAAGADALQDAARVERRAADLHVVAAAVGHGRDRQSVAGPKRELLQLHVCACGRRAPKESVPRASNPLPDSWKFVTSRPVAVFSMTKAGRRRNAGALLPAEERQADPALLQVERDLLVRCDPSGVTEAVIGPVTRLPRPKPRRLRVSSSSMMLTAEVCGARGAEDEIDRCVEPVELSRRP